jgi:hypothetical protein
MDNDCSANCSSTGTFKMMRSAPIWFSCRMLGSVVILALALFMVGLDQESMKSFGCSGIVITGDEAVIAGGTEDWLRSDSFMWATAADDGRHGVVCFGYEIRGEWGDIPPFWLEFQGINDEGLYFDSFGAPYLPPPVVQGKPYADLHIAVEAMEQCSTVAEVVELFGRCNLGTTIIARNQYLFVDRSGAAAVIDAGCVTYKEPSSHTFVVTNFRLSNPELGRYPCPRYRTASELLCLDASPTLDRASMVLRVVSQPITRYTVVADLTRRQARIYYRWDYDYFALLDVADLCKAGSPRVSIQQLVYGGE